MGMDALSSIVGLGWSEVARTPIGTARSLAADAARAAIRDAGLTPDQIDGMLLNQSSLAPAGTLPLQMIDDLGMRDLQLLAQIDGKGSSVLQMLQQATLMVKAGMASRVVCVFADAPVGESKASGAGYQNESPITGVAGWEGNYGLFGPVASHALLAQRYLHEFGYAQGQLGSYAIACRRWAALNPVALMPTLLTPEKYLAVRFIAEPLRLLDCAYPVNGAAAFVVAAAEAGQDGPQPPVYVHGIAQGHRTIARSAVQDTGFTGGRRAGAAAFAMAGITPRDIDMCQFYDAFSICAILALEDYGLCERGAGLAFIEEGATSPGGQLPVNTGGGHLAHAYLQGMTPLAEAVVQARRQAGGRQVERNDAILVNGSGGLLEYHAAAVLSPHTRLGSL